jgi:hypothetical protein
MDILPVWLDSQANDADCLEWEASLLKTDALYNAKLDILGAVGLEERQVFPVSGPLTQNELLLSRGAPFEPFLPPSSSPSRT